MNAPTTPDFYRCDGCELRPELIKATNPSGRFCPGHGTPKAARFEDFEQYIMLARTGADMGNDVVIAEKLDLPLATVIAVREMIPGMRMLLATKEDA